MTRRRRPYKVIMIRKSCLTGKVVWIYYGQSRAAANVAYLRAARAEIQRVAHWNAMDTRRRKNILHVRDECLTEIPITQALTPLQVDAARTLTALSKEEVPCHREFYNHVIEERRRRTENRRIREQMKLNKQ